MITAGLEKSALVEAKYLLGYATYLYFVTPGLFLMPTYLKLLSLFIYLFFTVIT